MLLKLRPSWHGTSYELLTRNCLHFCDALAVGLGVPTIPAYLNRMAYGADAVANFATSAYEQVTPLLCRNKAVGHTWIAANSMCNSDRNAGLNSGICMALPVHDLDVDSLWP